ncbi:hypothetical protein DFJ77DRAFT_477149 [Powellomyces hirtus]|nr:hypothetical protein DFJ77DRAFT_477149 [Powellomyces hirtus]
MSFFSFGQEPEPTEATTLEPSSAVPAAAAKQLSFDGEEGRTLSVIAEPVSSAAGVLYKRHAADVTFEIAATDDMEGENLLAQVVAQTDLIPGRYEGGLKTWECSIDLIDYLSSLEPGWLRGKRVMELGSGSSLPGIYCLGQGAAVDLQDYNEEVLHLVTVPNVLINATPIPTDAPHSSGTIEMELDYATLLSLPVRFWAGDWGCLRDAMREMPEENKYDVVLTAETIYAAESHEKLLDLVMAIVKPGGVVFIAAKSMYFGCSGSLPQFLQLAQKRLGAACSIETVWVETRTVRREIVKITF